MATPFYTHRQQVAVKIEGTEGTDSVPTVADVVVPAYDVEWTPDVAVAEREVVQPSYSQLSRVAGERSAKISFSTELKGSGTAGTAPPNLSAALKACGLAETVVALTSVTYAPASAALPSVTVEIREVDAGTVAKSKKIIGARGTFSFECNKGGVVLVKFEFTGRYVEPTETTAFSPQPAFTPNPVPFLGTAFSFLGFASLRCQQFSLDLGNEVALRNDFNQASGNFSAVITRRKPSGKVNPEQEAIATANFFNKMTTNTEGATSWALTGTSGNIVTFAAPKTQIVGISEGDRDGIRTEELTLAFNQSAAIGDDEFSIVMT